MKITLASVAEAKEVEIQGLVSELEELRMLRPEETWAWHGCVFLRCPRLIGFCEQREGLPYVEAHWYVSCVFCSFWCPLKLSNTTLGALKQIDTRPSI